MAYQKKTRYRKPGRAGGMTILKNNPAKDEWGRNIYFTKLGKMGAAAFHKKYGVKPNPQSPGGYMIVDREKDIIIASW